MCIFKRENDHLSTLAYIWTKIQGGGASSCHNNAFCEYSAMCLSYLYSLYIFHAIIFNEFPCILSIHGVGPSVKIIGFYIFPAPGKEGNRIVWQSCKANASIRIEAFGHPFIAKSRTDYICVHGGVKDARVDASQVYIVI